MSERKPYNYWRNIDVMIEAEKIMEENGFDILPGGPILRKLGYSSFAVSISKYHGGFSKLRKRLGEEPSQKPRGYWPVLDNALKEARIIMEKHGFDVLPVQAELDRLGHGDFVSAVGKHYGGLPAFRELLGQEQLRKPRGYRQDLENVIGEARNIMEELGVYALPGGTTLRRLGYGRFVGTIESDHGGIRAFRELLGQEQPQKPMGYWPVLDNALKEARIIMEKHRFDILPSSGTLAKLGYSSLSAAISSHHGGFSAFRELLGQELLQKPLGYWQNLENAVREAEAIMEEHGFDILPGQIILGKLGHSGFVSGITSYHGGLPVFRELLQERLNLPSEEQRLENLLEDYVS